MLVYLKLFAASTLTVILILFSWKSAYAYGCYMLFFPLLVLWVISYSFIELKIQERICFKNCYFKENSFFARLLSSKVFVTVFYIIISIMMSISALFGVLDYPKELWFYLIAHIFFCIFLYKYFHYLFKNTIKESYLSIFAREWTMNITALVLISIFIYLTYEPGYLRDSLKETILQASHSISSNCSITNYILKFKIEIDSMFWWIVSKGSDSFNTQLEKAGIWAIFLLINSLAILGINRFIVQIIYILDKLFKKVV